MSDRRTCFVRAALSFWGWRVLWGDLDCSELVARAGMLVGLPDRRATHTAQRYLEANLEGVEVPKPGDLGFYGPTPDKAIHVVIAIDAHHCISADGASRHVTTIEATEARKARVRIHTGTSWYRSAPFLGWRKHTELDEE